MTTTLRRRGSTDADDGPDTRPAARRWPVVLALSLLVALLVGGGVVVWSSPLLGLRTVQMAGPVSADVAAQARAAVDIPPGTPLIRIDLAAVHDRVAAVGPVASVVVRRQWPGTLVVTVTQRQPAAVTQADGGWWLLDVTGKPYQRVAAPPPGLIPLALATPGEGDPATLAALGVARSLTPTVREQVTGIAAPTAYDVSLALTQGRTVVWGSNTETAAKLMVLPALLQQPGTVYNITDPTLATVR